jgi:hypothetical protein
VGVTASEPTPEPESGEAAALRPEPDDEREDELPARPAPSGPSGPPIVPALPSDDEVAASAVAATGLDPQAPVDVLAARGAV